MLCVIIVKKISCIHVPRAITDATKIVISIFVVNVISQTKIKICFQFHRSFSSLKRMIFSRFPNNLSSLKTLYFPFLNSLNNLKAQCFPYPNSLSSLKVNLILFQNCLNNLEAQFLKYLKHYNYQRVKFKLNQSDKSNYRIKCCQFRMQNYKIHCFLHR